MASVLTIGGGTVNRSTSRVILNRLTLSLDRPDELEFSELGAVLPGSYHPEQAVTLTIDGTLSFSGSIYQRSPCGQGRDPITVGYRCLSLRYAAYMTPVTAADGTGTMSFNLSVTDQRYISTQAGLSVGSILSQVLSIHSAPLAALGIAADATTTAMLALMTAVPPEPVWFGGNNLWANVDQFLQQWYGSRYVSYITPAGLVRFYDTTLLTGTGSLTARTLTLPGEGNAFNDPIFLEQIAEDTSECYTAVVLRGRANVEPAYLSIHDNTLVPGWTSPQQSAWNWASFLYPVGAYSQGSISSVSSTAATVTSDDPAEAHIVNYWSGIQAWMALIDPIATTITAQEVRHITANTAYSAGGSYTVTLDHALTNSGYTRYQIRGSPGAVSNVWRRYNIPNTYVARHLAEQFNFAVPWNSSAGAVVLTNYPAAVVTYTTGGLTLQFPIFDLEIVPYDGTTDGYIRFATPTVAINNSQTVLNAGGAGVVAPIDIQVVVPYSRGTLRAVYPPSGFAGTAYSVFGVARTYYRDFPEWADTSTVTVANLTTLAQQIHATVSNVVVEGSILYFGKYTPALIGGSWPIAVNIAKDIGTTGYEAINAPVRTVAFEYMQGTATQWVTRMQFSTKRQAYSGDRLYVHPNYSDGPGWFQSQPMGMAPAIGPQMEGAVGTDAFAAVGSAMAAAGMGGGDGELPTMAMAPGGRGMGPRSRGGGGPSPVVGAAGDRPGGTMYGGHVDARLGGPDPDPEGSAGRAAALQRSMDEPSPFDELNR